MLFLLIAILGSSMVSIVMRLSSDKVSANLSMLAVNYLFCSLFGALYARFQLWVPEVPGFSLTTGLGLINGVLYLAGLVLLQRGVKKNGVVLASIFMKLGLLVPIVLSLVLFHEIPTQLQIVGFCLAIGAIILINRRTDSAEGKFGMGLIVLLLAGGSCDAMSKIFEVFGPAALSEQFLFYTFLMAFILSVALVIRGKERPGLQEVIFGLLIGIPNFFAAKFLLMALTKLPAVVVYPSFSVGTLLTVTLTGVAMFKERLGKYQWVALGTIVVALILLNI